MNWKMSWRLSVLALLLLVAGAAASKKPCNRVIDQLQDCIESTQIVSKPTTHIRHLGETCVEALKFYLLNSDSSNRIRSIAERAVRMLQRHSGGEAVASVKTFIETLCNIPDAGSTNRHTTGPKTPKTGKVWKQTTSNDLIKTSNSHSSAEVQQPAYWNPVRNEVKASDGATGGISTAGQLVVIIGAGLAFFMW